MTCLYIVRCNFAAADREQAWNDWYSGEKIRQMLAKPMFRAVQRFRLASGSGRRYLALWQVESREALNTAEYKADWGFADWRPCIVDWSRDLFEAGDLDDSALAVPMRGALEVASFDGMKEGQADAAREALMTEPAAMWFRSIGLDRHTPMIGLTLLAVAPETAPTRHTSASAHVGTYRPISEHHTAAALTHSGARR
jgi:hypothetical protein